MNEKKYSLKPLIIVWLVLSFFVAIVLILPLDQKAHMSVGKILLGIFWGFLGMSVAFFGALTLFHACLQLKWHKIKHYKGIFLALVGISAPFLGAWIMVQSSVLKDDSSVPVEQNCEIKRYAESPLRI